MTTCGRWVVTVGGLGWVGLPLGGSHFDGPRTVARAVNAPTRCFNACPHASRDLVSRATPNWQKVTDRDANGIDVKSWRERCLGDVHVTSSTPVSTARLLWRLPQVAEPASSSIVHEGAGELEEADGGVVVPARCGTSVGDRGELRMGRRAASALAPTRHVT